MRNFKRKELDRLFQPKKNSSGEENGQVTIIGGSKLFHGAPILSLKAASRIVDMVFFASPDPSVGEIANHIKSQLASFIWVPFNEVEAYISKSDAVLIGPGMMRYESEKQKERSEKIENDNTVLPVAYRLSHDFNYDEEGQKTRDITKRLLTKYPEKKWVIDAGSLQTMEVDWIPDDAIITPNKHEFDMLFGELSPEEAAKKHQCTIVHKGPEAIVSNGDETLVVKGGNAGLTKGGTGDTLAGLTAALFAKNESLLAASAAVFILKKTAEELEKRVGTNFNADDLANSISATYHKLGQN